MLNKGLFWLRPCYPGIPCIWLSLTYCNYIIFADLDAPSNSPAMTKTSLPKLSKSKPTEQSKKQKVEVPKNLMEELGAEIQKDKETVQCTGKALSSFICILAFLLCQFHSCYYHCCYFFKTLQRYLTCHILYHVSATKNNEEM